jgi:excisionase family DNA binding protein
MTTRRRTPTGYSPVRAVGSGEPDLPAASERIPLLLTVEQASGLLAVPPSWLKQRVAAHSITCTRLGRHIRFTREQLATIVAAGEQPAAFAPLTGLTRRSRRPA